MFGWWKRRRARRRSRGSNGVSQAFEGVGEVTEGCSGCGIDLAIGLTILTAAPLMLLR